MKKSLTLVFLVLTLVNLVSCNQSKLGIQTPVVITNTNDDLKDTTSYTKYLVTYNYTNDNGDTITQVLVYPKEWLVTKMLSVDEVSKVVKIDTLEVNIMESDL